MLRLAADENFDHTILCALRRRWPDLDLLTAQSAGLRGASDPVVLEWAAEEGRILLTHDVTTLVGFAYERVAAGLPMPGVFMVAEQAPIGDVLEERSFYVEVGEADDPRDLVAFIPEG